MNTKPFLTDMTDDQISGLESAILNHLKAAQYHIDLRNGSTQAFKPVALSDIEDTLGLAYTSGSGPAGLWVTNERLMYNDTHNIIGFGMDAEGSPIAWAWDEDENEIVVAVDKITAQSILQRCRVVGDVVKPPEITLQRDLYEQVKKSLELIGGKWKGGKVAGFVFTHDPTELLAEIAGGTQRNLKKEHQFFGTPDAIADKIVSLCHIQHGDTVLEPSAGQGALVKALNRLVPGVSVDCFENMPTNRTILKTVTGANIVGVDFLTDTVPHKYRVIIANPPFSKNQDIEHITRMWNCLDEDGTIVTVSSNHWRTSNNKKEQAFKQWTEDIGAEIHELPAGSFKDSGTNIACNILVIRK